MPMTISWGTNFGKVNCDLKSLMDSRSITISDMSKFADVKYDVVKRYYNNDVYQVDLQILAKFCYVLNCNIDNILNYEYDKVLETTGV